MSNAHVTEHTENVGGAKEVPSDPAVDRRALAAFAGAVVIGGSNFVAIRYSNRELDPLWGAGLRFGLAAVVFGVLCAALRVRLPRGRTLALVVMYGLLAFGGAYGCMYWAMQEVPAGVAAVVLAMGPLLTLLLAVSHGMERLSARALVGALVAIAGSVLIFFQPGSISFGWSSFALLGLAALFASESVVVSKLAGKEHPVAMNFVGMSAGAAVLLIVAGAAGENFALTGRGRDPAGGRVSHRRDRRALPPRSRRRAALVGVRDVLRVRLDAGGRDRSRSPSRR